MQQYISLFFTYEDGIPPEAGYKLFGTEHICIMLMCMVGICATVFVYSQLGDVRKMAMRRVLASLGVGLIAVRMMYVVLVNAEMKYELPLHLCGIAGVLCMLYECLGDKISKFISSTIEQVLFSLCLPGALMAIVFSDGTRYPAIHFITIQSNLYHSLVVAYIVMHLIDGRIHPNVREAYKSILFLVVVVPVVYAVDRALGANYMFLMGPSLGSPFTALYLSYGYVGYMLCYAAAVVIEIYAINMAGVALSRIMKRDGHWAR